MVMINCGATCYVKQLLEEDGVRFAGSQITRILFSSYRAFAVRVPSRPGPSRPMPLSADRLLTCTCAILAARALCRSTRPTCALS